MRTPAPRSVLPDGGTIPDKYTEAAGPAAISPALTWAYVRQRTVSFAVLAHDPDTALEKTPREFVHWIICNIAGTARGLPQGVRDEARLPDGCVQLKNSASKVGYVEWALLRRDLPTTTCLRYSL
jgi:Raf kinase inhibitor-like YbhB/YbcL family protein